jgi:hypothetical protein
MTKIDLKRVHGSLYGATTECSVVEVPEIAYLMIDGAGDPNTAAEYSEAVTALYAVAYRVKFISKGASGRDHVVMPLEGLWWADDMSRFIQDDKSDWKWRMLIAQPDHVTPDLVAQAIDEAVTKKKMATAQGVLFDRWREGRAAQVLHFGAYADEAPTIARLHAFISDEGLAMRGLHHEIYLNDPSRVAPEKLKTIIRQPVA